MLLPKILKTFIGEGHYKEKKCHCSDAMAFFYGNTERGLLNNISSRLCFHLLFRLLDSRTDT